ncbi:uroporphyrinogen-III synthase [Microbulbifer pacificus]|uniref:Uroporphyrinogen-III synthase n=1 Tax=Microbulbifer pacificus TaxID=407164 RepID=A0AAU0N318_9GAMM|nr:uroporphyrinogen-III synthase [Microbulbifer pacificus]WOX07165.1 uroporphyrinogen-III synthase [Microbulbifer pacificus]
MTSPLAGRRILITRPAHQSGGFRDLLQAQGAQVDSIPLLEITPITGGDGVQAIRNLVMDFDQFDHAIFVSQNAVQYAFDWLDDFWPQLPQGPRYYGIGAATASAIRARGAEPQSHPLEADESTMDSEALLALPALQNPRDERVIIFRGQGGRTLIGDTLKARGARLDYCELYRRVLPADATEQLRNYVQLPDAIVVHSGETLDNLTAALASSGRQQLLACPLVCPSPRVAASARAQGFVRAQAATNAGNSAMLVALECTLAGNSDTSNTAGHS